ncbi:biopolymer transporter ExbD [Kangiella sp. HZ709]|uniref:ExbD/TolR family protein n=1 Tax=Kangiella sp. HZ709 TaxID=2666328 RepID=UPI0012AEE32D|nr:biopolymer transporter ExbD [Kangiella sp. HZ709]MRX26813.1 biopolymer transporter ExbD [Kangiella sp. HZ709]
MWLKKRKEDLQINLTPLIDVVFLLLIFFMVSTSFKKETKITVNLPEASGEPSEALPASVDISITKAGEIYINGQGLLNRQIDTIKSAIQSVSNDITIPVVISSDEDAPVKAVIKVMDAAGQLGFSNIQMATQQPSEES